MPYRICKSFDIESGHLLSKHPEDCRFPHGHSRKVEFILEADDLDDNEMVCDFQVIKHLVGEVVDRFDHALCMNTADASFGKMQAIYGDRIIGFPDQDPTTEVLARYFFDALEQRLNAAAPKANDRLSPQQPVRVVKVRVWETRTSWAEYLRP